MKSFILPYKESLIHEHDILDSERCLVHEGMHAHDYEDGFNATAVAGILPHCHLRGDPQWPMSEVSQ